MKIKYLIPFILLLFVPISFANSIQEMHKKVVARQSIAAGGGETYVFHIEFDNDTDWATGGYTIGGNDYSAGDSVGSINNLSRFEQSSTYANSGTYSAKITPSTVGYMYYDVSSADIVDTDLGYFSGYIWVPVGLTGSNNFLFDISPGSNRLRIYIKSDYTGKIEYRGSDGSNVVSNTSSDTATGGAWNRIDCRWSVADNDLDIRIGAGSWDTLDSSMLAFDTAPSTSDFQMGSAPAGCSDTYYIDDISVWTDFTGPGD